MKEFIIVVAGVLVVAGVGVVQKVEASFPQANKVQNQNQVQLENKSGESQLEVATQEQEGQGETKPNNRSETARENMSDVAARVEELLTVREGGGGIGEQVRMIAQEQKMAQEQIREETNRLESRKGLLKKIVGPDYKAIKTMEGLMEQNRLRIQNLEQIAGQLQNQADLETVQAAIAALQEQNSSLQEQVTAEENSGSLLGWLMKLLAK